MLTGNWRAVAEVGRGRRWMECRGNEEIKIGITEREEPFKKTSQLVFFVFFKGPTLRKKSVYQHFLTIKFLSSL